jgi:hypothetical protein
MLSRVNQYARSHAFYINWYVSLLGAAGLGYLVLSRLTFGLMLSIALVFTMAAIKSYVFHVTSGQPAVPADRSIPYMVAWWLCFGLLAACFAVSFAAIWAVVLNEAATSIYSAFARHEYRGLITVTVVIAVTAVLHFVQRGRSEERGKRFSTTQP